MHAGNLKRRTSRGGLAVALIALLLGAGAGWAVRGQLAPSTPSTQPVSSAPVAPQEGPSVPRWPQQYEPGP